MTPAQAIGLYQKIMRLLKLRFPNLTVEETGELAGNIVLVITDVIAEEDAPRV